MVGSRAEAGQGVRVAISAQRYFTQITLCLLTLGLLRQKTLPGNDYCATTEPTFCNDNADRRARSFPPSNPSTLQPTRNCPRRTTLAVNGTTRFFAGTSSGNLVSHHI